MFNYIIDFNVIFHVTYVFYFPTSSSGVTNRYTKQTVTFQEKEIYSAYIYNVF